MNKTYTRRLGSSRRAFLGSVASAGAVLGAGLLSPESAQAVNGAVPVTIEGHRPNPIPGGVVPIKPFGIFVHHNPLKPGSPVADINDPSQITDFDGFVGLTHIRGGGTGTDTTSNLSQDLAYQADMGFAQGKYIGADGHQNQGTFVFVWLDLYTGPVGSANLPEQIHDYNVHVDSNDVFWMVQVDPEAVEVKFDEGSARLRVSGLKAFDDHDLANSLTDGLGLSGELGFPVIPPVFPVRATVSFDIEWNGIVDSADIHNDAQHFMGTFLSTGATISWSAEQEGFTFQSEAPNPTRNLISVLGREKNGVFFT